MSTFATGTNQDTKVDDGNNKTLSSHQKEKVITDTINLSYSLNIGLAAAIDKLCEHCRLIIKDNIDRNLR